MYYKYLVAVLIPNLFPELERLKRQNVTDLHKFTLIPIWIDPIA